MTKPNGMMSSISVDTTHDFARDVRTELYPRIPGLPESYEELMDCLAESEEEFECGETMSWESAKAEAKMRIREYAF